MLGEPPMIRMHSEEVLYAFHTVSGMDVSILDSDFHTVSLVRNPDTLPCTEIHRDPNAIDRCKASDIEHLSVVRKTLQPILYTCPFGITEAIVPILRDDTPIGYIIATLGIETGKEAEVLRRCAPHRAQSLSRWIDEAPKRTAEVLTAHFQILQMLAEYLANDGALAEGQKSIGQLVKRYVKNNLSRKLTLREIAKNLHCSTVTLTEHFREEFGITVNEYITKKRMELAEKFLLSTESPLREIALAVGFPDVEYFSRTFKKHYGDSPARWRKRNKEHFFLQSETK